MCGWGAVQCALGGVQRIFGSSGGSVGQSQVDLQAHPLPLHHLSMPDAQVVCHMHVNHGMECASRADRCAGVATPPGVTQKPRAQHTHTAASADTALACLLGSLLLPAGLPRYVRAPY